MISRGPERIKREHEPPTLIGSADLLLGSLLAIVAAFAALNLPEGDPWRVALTLPVIAIVPGYLLLEAAAPRHRSLARAGFRALFALGLSVAFVGLLALTTAIVDGGFRPATIVAVVTAACLVAAVVAYARRSAVSPRRSPALS